MYKNGEKMNKYLYFDLEICNDPTIVGWKNFKNLGMSAAVLGYENDEGEYEDLAFTNMKELFLKMAEFIKKGYIIVSYNGIEFDNNIISHGLGVIDVEDYLDLDVGGSKAGTTWRNIDDGYLNWCVSKKAGNYELCKAILDYRSGKTLDSTKKTVRQIREFLNSHTLDLMVKIDEMATFSEKYSVGLDSVCELTINKRKTRKATEVFELYKNGKIDEIVEYCKNDTKILYELYKFILQYKYVLIPENKKFSKLMPNNCLKVRFEDEM